MESVVATGMVDDCGKLVVHGSQVGWRIAFAVLACCAHELVLPADNVDALDVAGIDVYILRGRISIVNVQRIAAGRKRVHAPHTNLSAFPRSSAGLPDYAAEKFSHYDLSYAGGRPLFATVGSFENRKGQDSFCKAIRLLPPETMKKASFLFVGKAAEAEMMDAVRSLTADCPDNVFYVKRLTRDEIKSLMAQCTCLVCASRDDPMPTFVTEGLIFGKPAIVSEHTGTAGLITEGVDGFVYEDDDPEKLAERLAWAIEHPEKLAAMRPACRELYESHYSKQAFSDSLQQAVKELTGE